MSDIKLPPLPKPDRLMENDDYLICGYTQDQMENYARAAMAATPAPHDVPAAMRAVIAAMKADPEYAWSWHCNVAMAFVDAGGDHYTANQGAARFMRALAGVEPAHELPALAATPAPAEPVAWTLRETLDKRQTTCSARLWFTNPGNFGWVPLYAEPWAAMLAAAPEVTAAPADSGLEALRKMLQEAVDQLKVPTPAPHPDTADAERYRKLVASGKYTAASIGGGWGLSCGGARWSKAELDAAADALPAPRAQAQKGE